MQGVLFQAVPGEFRRFQEILVLRRMQGVARVLGRFPGGSKEVPSQFRGFWGKPPISFLTPALPLHSLADLRNGLVRGLPGSMKARPRFVSGLPRFLEGSFHTEPQHCLCLFLYFLGRGENQRTLLHTAGSLTMDPTSQAIGFI